MEDSTTKAHRRGPAASRFRRRGLAVLFAVALVVFVYGIQIARTQAFPYGLMRSVWWTVGVMVDAHSSGGPHLYASRRLDLPAGEVEARRIVLRNPSGLIDRVIFPGGAGRFAELCPGHPGCIAVEYVGQGRVARAYPYRPSEIEEAAVVDLPYETVFGVAPQRYVFALDTYPNGDLLVVFHYRFVFPYGGGVARIRPDGTAAWYRRDYSHHEAHIAADDVAWVPGLRIGQGPLRVHYEAPKQSLGFELPCARPYVDSVRKIGPDGELLEDVPLFEKLAASPYRFLLRNADDPCDPLHVNSVHELGPDATGPSGIGPGDLVVSVRHLKAFVVLDRNSFDIKTLVRGTFDRQHSVKHLTGSQFLVFDNDGVGADRDGPSRVLRIDVADGGETTLFPGPSTSKAHQHLFSMIQGQVSISPDRKRVVATFYWHSKALEIEIATGRVLTEFTDLHDLTPLGRLAGDARVVRYRMTPGIRYVLDP